MWRKGWKFLPVNTLFCTLYGLLPLSRASLWGAYLSGLNEHTDATFLKKIRQERAFETKLGVFEKIWVIVSLRRGAIEDCKYNKGRQANEAGRREIPLGKMLT